MKSIREITRYVEEFMSFYHISDYGFFHDYDPDVDDVVEIPLFPDGTADEETLKRLSIHLGLTREEILNADQDASDRYWKRYPFLNLYNSNDFEWSWTRGSLNREMSREDRLLAAILGKETYTKHKLYDRESVKQRMVSLLKRIDKTLPGTYHKNAKILDLDISTEVFLSFPDCGKMLQSFLDMVDRLRELFDETLKKDLSESDQMEMNFLCSFLEVEDRIQPLIKLSYPVVKNLREIYNEENYPGLLWYARIKRVFGLAPWKYTEFFDDPELVKRFVEAFPEAKGKIREFAMQVSQFTCTFRWSDVEVPKPSPEEEFEPDWFLNQYGEIESVPPEWITTVYVPKTEEELFDWGASVKRIRKAASPESKGGLKAVNYDSGDFVGIPTLNRISRRETALRGGAEQ